MYPGTHALERPDHPAVVMAGSGEVMTYRELDERSNQFAHLCRSLGVQTGDRVAAFLENRVEYFEVLWGSVRTGLYLTAINRYLTAHEAGYILADSGAKVLVTSEALLAVATEAFEQVPACTTMLVVGGDGTSDRGVAGEIEPYDRALGRQPVSEHLERTRGDLMLYSSGTTGKPKGIRHALTGEDIAEPSPRVAAIRHVFGYGPDTTLLSTAPLYHSSPIGSCWAAQALGGTVVVMERFDAEAALSLIERYRVTHSQFVPTMFIRMLKLPAEVRERYDLTSHRCSTHTAAPCPTEVKRQMMDWWGPIIHEIYGGTERSGSTYASPQDWLSHPGTVGRSIVGTIHICDEDGVEVAAGEVGTVYFELDRPMFQYHQDEVQTRRSQHPHHPTWTTLGDIGRLDHEGFLYLTDRTANLIISGGVNIYPREIEDLLILHPSVDDVAVVGVPHADMGEQVKAVVQPTPGVHPGVDLTEELTEYARAHLAGYKVPRSFEFVDQLPRLPTGKLYKRLIRDRYWEKAERQI